jgi:phytoene dehydrogenase-like protein
MTESFDVIVIGAGHNGLVCAALLAKQGRRVLVLEAGQRCGGAAQTREFAPGFSVSPCAHLVQQLHPVVSGELELERHGLRYAARDLPTIALGADGRHATLQRDRLDGDACTTAERAVYGAFMQRMTRFAAVLDGAYLERPPRLAGGNDFKDTLTLARLGMRVRRLGRDDMRELLRIGAINIHDVLQEEFTTEIVKGALAFDAVLGAQLGPRSPNSVLHFLHRQNGVARDGVSLPQGGMRTVAGALEASATAAGARILTGTAVASLLIEDDRVRGVRTASGDEYRANLVVSAADPHTTFLKLVGATRLEAGFTRRVSNIRMSGNVARLHLALTGLPKFTGLSEAQLGARLLIAPSPVDLERAFDESKYGAFSSRPCMEIVIPSVHDAGLAPAGAHVLSASLIYAPYTLREGWDAGRARLLAACRQQLERYAPGIGALIAHAELLAPPDLEREFRMHGGHWHHGEYSLDQFMMLRPVPGAAQYATPVPGLWLCGAGSHPGGGISGLPGRNAAREILRRGSAA